MWNGVRGVWEKPGTVNLLCEHSELFSESWPTSGTMRNGRAFEHPMSVLPTNDSESLLLRTPAASEAERGHQPEEKAKARGGQVTLSGQFMNLPTPTVADTFTDKLKSSQQKEGSMHSVNLSQAVHLMPTPNTMDDLPARDESKIDRSKGGFSNVRETVVRSGFGRFEPVIRRWEKITGNEAPEPTKPDGKDGNLRLSSQFTEWMMGLEPGWITGVGLSRKDELKACGNGVVPQQAKLALTILLDRLGV
jgi:DNA (cytosine-5)-methyltransferase 1